MGGNTRTPRHTTFHFQLGGASVFRAYPDTALSEGDGFDSYNLSPEQWCLVFDFIEIQSEIQSIIWHSIEAEGYISSAIPAREDSGHLIRKLSKHES